MLSKINKALRNMQNGQKGMTGLEIAIILITFLTVAHHKHESRGGTRTSPLKYYYYYLGAHAIFLMRNYRWKARYMVRACMSFLALNVLRSGPALVFGKE